MEKQLVSKIGAGHAMAGAECPVCLDTLCEVVRLFLPVHIAHFAVADLCLLRLLLIRSVAVQHPVVPSR
jgi:hypothetical protein